MPAKVFIADGNLTQVLAKWAEAMEVWVPAVAGTEGGPVVFRPYGPGVIPLLQCQSSLPPKKILLPQGEALLKFAYRKDPADPARVRVALDDLVSTPPPVSRPFLLFGVRPCDTRGFLTFDHVFLRGPYVDAIYRRRREQTLFATLVCTVGDDACFCSSVGSGPADMEGSDLRLTPITGGFLLESLNERADLVIEEAAGTAAVPSSVQDAEAGEIQEQAARQRQGEPFPEGFAQTFRARFDDREYWQEAAAACLSCGICTYVCPTCYCFTITDEIKDLEGERWRSWDSCMFQHYTAEASGHNPRPTKLERYRNRVGHKFSYIPERYEGLVGCCGCGRCVRTCPVGIDIRRAVLRLKEEVCAGA